MAYKIEKDKINTNKEKSILTEIEEVLKTIIRESKDTPYALVTALSSFILIFFIIFGSAICNLSNLGKDYCWLSIVLIILFNILFAFIITLKSIQCK